METNFQFLRKINKDLYDLALEAEKLYRDEYFEQCMVQTRRFGEQICKDMLQQNNKKTGSFDEMLSTLQDYTNGSVQEKEFIDDLYFLKKNGNQSVHSGKIKKDAMAALECLKRAFEVAINYSVYNQGASGNILKLNYDVELLITNKKSKPSLTQKYEQEKRKSEITKPEKNIISRKKDKSKAIRESNIKENIHKTQMHIPLFWKIVIVLSSVSILIIIFLGILVAINK